MSDENTLNPETATNQDTTSSQEFQAESGQNLPLAVVGGLAASLVGAGIWAVVTILTNYQIGWMAIGVGFMTGFAVQILGKGYQPVFGVIGAFFALLGCFLGNLFAMVHFGTAETGMGFFELLFALDLSTIVEVMTGSFQIMDALFYAMALYTGFKYSFRQ